MPANMIVAILYLPARAQLRIADKMHTTRKAVDDSGADVDILGTISARNVVR